MEIELNETQRGARDTARRFAREKLERSGVEPIARISSRPKRFPSWVSSGCSASSSPTSMAVRASTTSRTRSSSKSCRSSVPATGVIVSAHSSLGAWPILGIGDEAQRRKYLPRMASGEWLGCFRAHRATSRFQRTARRPGRSATAIVTLSMERKISSPMVLKPRYASCSPIPNPPGAIAESAPLSLKLRRRDSRSRASRTRWGFTAHTARN